MVTPEMLNAFMASVDRQDVYVSGANIQENPGKCTIDGTFNLIKALSAALAAKPDDKPLRFVLEANRIKINAKIAGGTTSSQFDKEKVE